MQWRERSYLVFTYLFKLSYEPYYDWIPLSIFINDKSLSPNEESEAYNIRSIALSLLKRYIHVSVWIYHLHRYMMITFKEGCHWLCLSEMIRPITTNRYNQQLMERHQSSLSSPYSANLFLDHLCETIIHIYLHRQEAHIYCSILSLYKNHLQNWKKSKKR